MRNLKSSSIIILFIAGMFYVNEQFLSNDNTTTSGGFTLIGSTPGDPLIKSMLHIRQDKEVDFIRWTLSMDTTRSDSNNFTLNLEYGLSQPNTTGFAQGRVDTTIAGKYVIINDNHTTPAEVYQFIYDGTASPSLSLKILNDNVFHVLTPDNKLMSGNSGWSYTLSRKNHRINQAPTAASLANNPFRSEDKGESVVFAGRTPCGEIAGDYNFKVNEDCFKLKWKLTLHRDKNTLLPTKYTLRRTDQRTNDIEGNWDIVNMNKNNCSLTIYRLDPDKPGKTISLLAGDDNVLFFMDKKQNLYVGNQNFSYTINRLSR